MNDWQLYLWGLQYLRDRLKAEGLDWTWRDLPSTARQSAPERLDDVPNESAERLGPEVYAAG